MRQTNLRLLAKRLEKENETLRLALMQMAGEAQQNSRSRVMLYAGLVRRFGADDGKGSKVIELNEKELTDAPPGEMFQINPPTEERKTVVMRLYIEPKAEGTAAEPITDPSRLLPANAQPHPDDPKEVPRA